LIIAHPRPLRCRIIGVHPDRQPMDEFRLLYPFSHEGDPFLKIAALYELEVTDDYLQRDI
jgi:hypothetical protein